MCCSRTTHTSVLQPSGLSPGLSGWAGTRKVKPIWILLKQKTVSGSGISWAICKSAPRPREITMPALHHPVFTGRCPSCRPTNSVKALKARTITTTTVLWLSGFRAGLLEWASTKKVKPKPTWISWSKRQWVAVGSAEPYEKLHLGPVR